MKKITFALMAVSFWVTGRAAVVDWRYEISEATDSPNYRDSNFMVYLVKATAWDNVLEVNYDTFLDANIVLSNGAFVDRSGKSASSRSYSTADNGIATLPDSVIAIGGTLSAYYVVVDSTANKYTVSSAVTLTGREAIGEQITTGFGSTPSASLNWQDIGAGPTPVPEPTTGLLVLAGLAGLALRRRRA